MELDRWSEERDKLLAAPRPRRRTWPSEYGVADLDAAGEWVHHRSRRGVEAQSRGRLGAVPEGPLALV